MGYVYLIKMGDTSYYKIGISRVSVESRLAQLQTSNPIKLELIGSYEHNEPLVIEQWIHESLKEYRVRGEWFNDNGAMEIERVFHEYNTMAEVDRLMESVTVDNDMELDDIYVRVVAMFEDRYNISDIAREVFNVTSGPPYQRALARVNEILHNRYVSFKQKFVQDYIEGNNHVTS